MGRSVGKDQAFYNFSECKNMENFRFSPSLDNIKYLPQLKNLTELDIRFRLFETNIFEEIPANSLPLLTCLSIASEHGKTYVSFANACPNLQVIYAYSVTNTEPKLGSYFREMILKCPELELLTLMVACDNVDHDEILFDVGTILPKLKYLECGDTNGMSKTMAKKILLSSPNMLGVTTDNALFVRASSTMAVVTDLIAKHGIMHKSEYLDFYSIEMC